MIIIRFFLNLLEALGYLASLFVFPFVYGIWLVAHAFIKIFRRK